MDPPPPPIQPPPGSFLQVDGSVLLPDDDDNHNHKNTTNSYDSTDTDDDGFFLSHLCSLELEWGGQATTTSWSKEEDDNDDGVVAAAAAAGAAKDDTTIFKVQAMDQKQELDKKKMKMKKKKSNRNSNTDITNNEALFGTLQTVTPSTATTTAPASSSFVNKIDNNDDDEMALHNVQTMDGNDEEERERRRRCRQEANARRLQRILQASSNQKQQQSSSVLSGGSSTSTRSKRAVDNNNNNKNPEDEWEPFVLSGNAAVPAGVVGVAAAGGTIAAATPPTAKASATTPTAAATPPVVVRTTERFLSQKETMPSQNKEESLPPPPTVVAMVVGAHHQQSSAPDDSVLGMEDPKDPPPPPETRLQKFSKRWTAGISRIHAPVLRALQWLSQKAARNPYRTIGIVCFLSLVLPIIGLLTNFTYSVEETVLWTPMNSPPEQHRAWLQSTWGSAEGGYRPFLLFFHRRGGNVLFRNDVQHLFVALDAMRNAPGYEEVCALSNYPGFDQDPTTTITTTTCEINGAVRFWNNSAELFAATTFTDDDARETMSDLLYPDFVPVDTKSIFGFPQRDNATYILQSAMSFSVTILLPDEEVTKDLEEEALDVLLDLRQVWRDDPTIDLELEVLSMRSYSDEFERAILKDIPLFPAVFVLMSLFVTAVFARRDKVHSRCLVGAGAVMTCMMSLFTGFGVLFISGVPFTTVTQMIPFLIIGIGLDDAFIIMGSFSRRDPSQDVVLRLRDTIDDIGVSIALTSFTSCLAFVLGCFSSIPAIFWLCLYAFPLIFIDFIYQITFFPALIVLDERRIAANRRDICFWISVHKDDDDAEDGSSASGKFADKDDLAAEVVANESGRVITEILPAAVEQSPSGNHKDYIGNENMQNEEAYDGSVLRVGHLSNLLAENQDEVSTRPPGNAEKQAHKVHFADRFMGWYARQLLKWWVRLIVLVGFAVLTSLCSVSASQLTQEFKFTDYVPFGSYITDYIDSSSMYTAHASIIPFVYFRDVDQADESIRNQMDAYVTELVNGVDAMTSEPVYFWVPNFRMFVETNGLQNLRFYDQLETFLEDPVYSRLFGEDFLFDENGKIFSTRCWLTMDEWEPNNLQLEMATMKQQQAVTEQFPINNGSNASAKFFNYAVFYHMWDFYNTVVDELTLTSILGVSSVAVVALLFVPHWTACIFITPIVCMLYVDLMGVLQWAGLHINAISYVITFMGIGLFVDYLMHVLFSYYEAAGNRQEKMVEMMTTMGASILLGGLTTLLGMVPLVFSTSTVFYTIFIAALGLVALGMGHGLILMPVILSMIGPEEQVIITTANHHKDDRTDEEEEVESKTNDYC